MLQWAAKHYRWLFWLYVVVCVPGVLVFWFADPDRRHNWIEGVVFFVMVFGFVFWVPFLAVGAMIQLWGWSWRTRFVAGGHYYFSLLVISVTLLDVARGHTDRAVPAFLFATWGMGVVRACAKVQAPGAIGEA